MNRDDVINKVFPHSLFGYDPVAVDAFLDEVIKEFDRLNNTIDVLKLTLSQELTDARMTNDMLSASLARADFASRANELTAPPPAEPEAVRPGVPEIPETTDPEYGTAPRSGRKNRKKRR
ncbi:MAG: DivIVA domain-containing protein [Clostridia bacterium]|nr:DivIVA domain-containing protein [Clostridia bacterium]